MLNLTFSAYSLHFSCSLTCFHSQISFQWLISPTLNCLVFFNFHIFSCPLCHVYKFLFSQSLVFTHSCFLQYHRLHFILVFYSLFSHSFHYVVPLLYFPKFGSHSLHYHFPSLSLNLCFYTFSAIFLPPIFKNNC